MPNDLVRHEVKEHKVCSICYKFFKTRDGIRHHYAKNHSEQYYLCSLCDFITNSKRNIDLHYQRVHFKNLKMPKSAKIQKPMKIIEKSQTTDEVMKNLEEITQNSLDSESTAYYEEPLDEISKNSEVVEISSNSEIDEKSPSYPKSQENDQKPFQIGQNVHAKSILEIREPVEIVEEGQNIVGKVIKTLNKPDEEFAHKPLKTEFLDSKIGQKSAFTALKSLKIDEKWNEIGRNASENNQKASENGRGPSELTSTPKINHKPFKMVKEATKIDPKLPENEDYAETLPRPKKGRWIVVLTPLY